MKTSNWILCDEKLPDYDQAVWLHENGRIWIGVLVYENEGWVWANTYNSVWYDAKSRKWECDAELDDDYQPDYWMSLPEPPHSQTAQNATPGTPITHVGRSRSRSSR